MSSANRKVSDRLLRSVVAANLLLAAAPVLAQDDAMLGEIVVTAQKRLENVREVPASVSVVDGGMLEDLHATQLTDFAAYVPGFQVISTGAPGRTAIALRGVAPISPSSTIGTYIDESPLGSSNLYQRATEFSLDLLPYDLERVEVLRGPQGTLYGAGSMGGLVKYVMRDPDLSDFEFRVGGGVSDVQGGADEGSNLRAGANVPLVKDSVALRASYARNELPGYIDGAVDGEEDINDASQESARAALLWEAGEAVSVKLTAMRQSIDSDNNAFVAFNPATQAPLLGDLRNGPFVGEPFEKQIDFYAATLQWDLGWADFTSASGYSETSTDQRNDATALLRAGLGAPIFAFFDLGLDLERLTQELRLTSKASGDIEWQIGAFYSDEQGDNSQIVRLLAPDGTTPFPGLDPLVIIALPSDYRERALFANGAYRFTDSFKLGAGVRYASNDQNFTQDVLRSLLPTIPEGRFTGESDEDVFTWSLTPQWQITKDAMLYGKVATGYQPGGPNIVLPGVPRTVDAATLTSYEVGLKSDFLDSRVLFDLTLFYLDWQDIQISAATDDGTASFLVNGGEAVSQGVELSTVFSVTKSLRIGLNGAYTDARITEDVAALGGRDNDNLPFIPFLSWAATADYSFGLGGAWNGHVGAGFRWVGDRKNSLDSAPGVATLDSYNALDLNADFGDDHWTFRVYGKNVTDERAYTFVGGALAAPILPRTLGLEVDIRF